MYFRLYTISFHFTQMPGKSLVKSSVSLLKLHFFFYLKMFSKFTKSYQKMRQILSMILCAILWNLSLFKVYFKMESGKTLSCGKLITRKTWKKKENKDSQLR